MPDGQKFHKDPGFYAKNTKAKAEYPEAFLCCGGERERYFLLLVKSFAMKSVMYHLDKIG